MTYITTQTRAAPGLKCMVFCLVAAFISNGYAEESDTVKSTESHADYSVTELEAIVKAEVTIKEKRGVVLRWKDTEDGGDSPMTSGCHMEYQTADCSDAGVYFGGDSCITARKLMEYTDAGCHERDPIDLKDPAYDCNKECTDANHWFGRCQIDATACDGQPSAYCRCYDRPPVAQTEKVIAIEEEQ